MNDFRLVAAARQEPGSRQLPTRCCHPPRRIDRRKAVVQSDEQRKGMRPPMSRRPKRLLRHLHFSRSTGVPAPTMTTLKTRATALYVVSALLSLTLAMLSYQGLCPSNSNPCFKTWVINACMVLACLGFIPMYGVRAWIGPLEQQDRASTSWRLRTARILHVVGAALVWAALGWLLGGSFRSFV